MLIHWASFIILLILSAKISIVRIEVKRKWGKIRYKMKKEKLH